MRSCVGMGTAVDWGQAPPPRLDWRLVRRIFGTFDPYRRQGALTLLCLLLVAAAVGASLAAGWLGWPRRTCAR